MTGALHVSLFPRMASWWLRRRTMGRRSFGVARRGRVSGAWSGIVVWFTALPFLLSEARAAVWLYMCVGDWCLECRHAVSLREWVQQMFVYWSGRGQGLRHAHVDDEARMGGCFVQVW